MLKAFSPKVKYIKNILNKSDKLSLEYSENLNRDITHKERINGWIKTYRNQQTIYFLAINDGSTTRNLQVIYSLDNADDNNKEKLLEILNKLSVGSAVELEGYFVKPPGTSKEKVEMLLTDILNYGEIRDRDTYILNKGRVKPEVIRQYGHLRPKTNLFSSIFRIRNAASYAVHSFFQESGFYHLDPNIFTTSDCEGAGEIFQIISPGYQEEVQTALKEGKELKESDKHFFKKEVFMVVSSQLQLEAICNGLGNCYTTNPSGRAEKSNTTRHLAQFTHVEYELSFSNLDDLMNLSELFVKYVTRYVLNRCSEDIEFLNKRYTKGLLERLEGYLEKDFPRISYTDAISILEKAARTKKSGLKVKQNDLPKWGDDLGSTCEKYLAEVHYKSPILVYNYPKSLKSFYMKEDSENPDVVNCMDLLIPHIGELIGSSVREDNYEKLIEKMDKKGIDKVPLEWYLDLRKNGTWRHSGGGLGFDRLIGMLTMDSKNFNIRDCTPFPVAYGECMY
jgi:asparaginyl-tRNA synthetase